MQGVGCATAKITMQGNLSVYTEDGTVGGGRAEVHVSSTCIKLIFSAHPFADSTHVLVSACLYTYFSSRGALLPKMCFAF